jgi:hypothetical protein
MPASFLTTGEQAYVAARRCRNHSTGIAVHSIMRAITEHKFVIRQQPGFLTILQHNAGKGNAKHPPG